MTDFAAARRNMIESQLRTNQIADPALLDAMASLPREHFLPEALKGIAYVDEDIPLADGRCLTEPLVLARLLQLALPTKENRALDIAPGPGYSTALLARLCHDVVGVEADHGWAEAAAKRLQALDIRNAWVVEAPLAEGYRARAPYDVILLGGAVEGIPPSLTDQLAEGGRLVTVLRPPGKVGRSLLMTRRGGLLESRTVWDAATHPLPGFARPREFTF
jgi:protein-L-isoaspartate(D-aspartate) O-methyltransferase